MSGGRRSSLEWVGLVALRCCELALLCLMVAGIVGIALVRYYSQDLPETATLATHRPFETTRIYARDGETLLYELFDGGQRTLIPLADIPWSLKAATIAVEDADFYTNPGVDLRGIARALYLNRDGQVLSGGSTITQQLARGVLLPPSERAEQTYRRKIREAILAFRVSREFSKDQILAMYLNEIYYGNMAYGIEAAAQSYFGHSARTLTLAEASLLAGLPQSPTVLNPLLNPTAAKQRQKIVLDLMVRSGLVESAQANAAYAETLELRSPASDIRYPHWVFYVRDLLEQQFGPDLVYQGGLRVVTTLDPALQELAMESASTQIAELAERNATNASVVIVDPRTSEILAMVGSVDYNDPAIDGQVNVALAPRQPGSTLKPLVYAAALATDWTPATIIWDTPTDFGGYQPQNYDNRFHGPQRVRMALAGSLNIPAVKALQHVGLDAFLELAHRMGITTLQERDRYGLAVALGAGEVRLVDLVTAYSAFANQGRARTPVALLRVSTNLGETLLSATPQPGVPVFGNRSAQVAYLITHILSDNAARTPIFGPDSVMRLDGDRPAAVKTGTSNDYKDSWAVGYTPDLVVGAWVGNSDNTAMEEVAGANGAGLIWRAIMEQAHAGKPPLPFERPEGIVEQPVCPVGGTTATDCSQQVPEVFLADVPPREDDGAYVRVTVGGDGTCLAMDATPAAERRSVLFLKAPPDALEWVTAAGIPQAPLVPCAAPGAITATSAMTVPLAVAAITSPRTDEYVGGVVSIWGNAAGPYVLEAGAGDAPSEWATIASGSGSPNASLLGLWPTADRPAGVYSLRLLVALPGSPQQETRLRVILDPAGLTVRLVQPAPNTTIRAGSLLTLAAEASGPVAQIEVRVDDQLLGSEQGSSATISWVAVGAGQHTIVAEVVAEDGSRTRSQPVVVEVLH